MSTRPKSETMPPTPPPPSSDRRDAAIEELRRGTQLAALLRQQVELIPELDRRDAAVANVTEISMAMESSLSILHSESEQSSSSEAGAVAMAAPASYYSSGGAGSRNGAVFRARKVRHRRGKHGEELPIWKCSKEVVTEAPENDPFHWRKYGEKKILNAEHPRLYYKCGYSDDHRCPARKYVQQQNNSDPPVYMVTFIDEHTCTALFPDQHSSSSGASHVLDFTKVSLSPPLAGVPGLKKEEEPTYAYDESSPSLPSLSPNGDQIDFSPKFGW
ncbi:hypothetical protein ACP70R_039751 [Stipagrostis hirtigluma subsp. patula]